MNATNRTAALMLLVSLGTLGAVAQETEPTVDPTVGLEVTDENARSIEAYNAAIIAAQEGKLVESISRLEAFIAAGPPEALKTKATEQLSLIRAERRKQHTVEFNEAVRHVKRRELAPAEALLRGILADGPDESMRRSVAKQLGVIERAKPRQGSIVGAVPLDDDAGSESKKKKKSKTKRDQPGD